MRFHDISQRRACALIAVDPKTVRRERPPDRAMDAPLVLHDVPAGPFHGFNRERAEPSDPVIDNSWHQGMRGGANAHSDSFVSFSQTDFRDEMKAITAPVLVFHGEDDQVVPFKIAVKKSGELLQNSTLMSYLDFQHGIPTTEAETINKDLLAWLFR